MPRYYVDKELFRVVPLTDILPYIEATSSIRLARLRVLLALAFMTGARVAELLRLRKGDFRTNPKRELRIRLFTLKTYSSKRYRQAHERKVRLIPPTRELIFDADKDPFMKDVIIPFLRTLDNREDKLFNRTKRWYQQKLFELNSQIHGEKLEKYITFHYLRHSAITHIARDLGGTGADIQGWTGHRGSSFEIYIIPAPVEKFKGKMGER